MNETNTGRHYSIDADGWTQVRISSVLADQDELDRLRAELASHKRLAGVVTCSYCGQRYQFPVTTTIRYRSMAMMGHVERCPYNPHNVWAMEALAKENRLLQLRLHAIAKLAGIEVEK